MISDEARTFILEHPYRRDAEFQASIVPLGGIYWEDEIPDFQLLYRLSDDARNEVLRLFAKANNSSKRRVAGQMA